MILLALSEGGGMKGGISPKVYCLYIASFKTLNRKIISHMPFTHRCSYNPFPIKHSENDCLRNSFKQKVNRFWWSFRDIDLFDLEIYLVGLGLIIFTWRYFWIIIKTCLSQRDEKINMVNWEHEEPKSKDMYTFRIYKKN